MLKKRFFEMMPLIFGVVLVFALVGCGGNSTFVGKWIPENGGKAPSGLPDDLELFKDGTGVCEGMSVKWKVEKERFILTSSLIGGAWNYEISDSKLILTADNSRSFTYRRDDFTGTRTGNDPNGNKVTIDIDGSTWSMNDGGLLFSATYSGNTATLANFIWEGYFGTATVSKNSLTITFSEGIEGLPNKPFTLTKSR